MEFFINLDKINFQKRRMEAILWNTKNLFKN